MEHSKLKSWHSPPTFSCKHKLKTLNLHHRTPSNKSQSTFLPYKLQITDSRWCIAKCQSAILVEISVSFRLRHAAFSALFSGMALIDEFRHKKQAEQGTDNSGTVIHFRFPAEPRPAGAVSGEGPGGKGNPRLLSGQGVRGM